MPTRLLRDDRGANLVEYLMLVALLALVALGALRSLGGAAQERVLVAAECVRTLSTGCTGAAGSRAGGAGVGSNPAGWPLPPPPPGHAASSGAPSSSTGAKPATPAESAGGTGGSSGPGSTKEPSAAQVAQAQALVSAGGSATEADARVVVAELAKLPVDVLRYMADNGVRVVVAQGSVTDYLTELQGVRPRGWPPGATWDTVPGLAHGSEVVIAVRDGKVPAPGDGHGSHNLVIHETFHAIDHVGGFSENSDFRAAHNADTSSLDAYETQAGAAGREEAYAESAARYYGGDQNSSTSTPLLTSYWSTRNATLGSDP